MPRERSNVRLSVGLSDPHHSSLNRANPKTVYIFTIDGYLHVCGWVFLGVTVDGQLLPPHKGIYFVFYFVTLYSPNA